MSRNGRTTRLNEVGKHLDDATVSQLARTESGCDRSEVAPGWLTHRTCWLGGQFFPTREGIRGFGRRKGIKRIRVTHMWLRRPRMESPRGRRCRRRRQEQEQQSWRQKRPWQKTPNPSLTYAFSPPPSLLPTPLLLLLLLEATGTL